MLSNLHFKLMCSQLKIGRAASAAIFLTLLSIEAQAADEKNCSYSGGATGPATYEYNPPATITLNGNEPVGQTLWSAGALGNAIVGLSCPPVTGYAGLIGPWGSTSTYSAGANVLPTSIPGIGYYVVQSAWKEGIKGYPDNPDYQNSSTAGGMTLVFVRIAGQLPTVDRVIPAGLISTWFVGSNKVALATYKLNNSVTFKMPGRKTCVITAPTSVALGTVRQSAFNGVGTGAAWNGNFNIAFECKAMRAKVYMTMGDAITPGNRSDKLSLDSTSTATGLGVQLQMVQDTGNTIISMGPDSSAVGNVNQFFVFDTTANENYTARFQARMVQTADAVGAGSVASKAVFTVSYQ